MIPSSLKSIVGAVVLITTLSTTNEKAMVLHKSTNNALSQSPIFSFGIVSDIHHSRAADEGSRHYTRSLDKLNNALLTLSNAEPDFIISLGDLIDRDYHDLQPVLKEFTDCKIKTYHVLGNHDYNIAGRHKRSISDITETEEGYYSFNHYNYRFIILNGNEIATYAPSLKNRRVGKLLLEELTEREAVNANSYNGAISSEQLSWLDSELSDAKAIGQKVFIMCHFPVLPEDRYNLLNHRQVLDIIGKYNNIIAWFNGHNHKGGYENYNLTHFVTLKGMVETAAENSYALVDVYSNKIWINGYEREKSQILAY